MANTDVVEKWKNAALADLGKILCTQMKQTTGKLPGIVMDDTTVILSNWYSDVSEVTTPDGRSIGFVCGYDQGHDSATDIGYTKTLTVEERLPNGMLVDVSGTYGIDSSNLPQDLQSVLEAICSADENYASGQSNITSKSIEDVSVSIQLPSGELLETALKPYVGIISEWSLCPSTEYGGYLSYPIPIRELPWFLNPQDVMGKDVAYGSAIM